MSAKNFINPHLRPGILSIDVYSAVNQIAINKAGPGEEVGFTVNAQSGFYLTSWRAYYADAYGDIVDLELTPTTISTYSWTFTMPDSDVTILCEAEGESQTPGGYITLPLLDSTNPTAEEIRSNGVAVGNNGYGRNNWVVGLRRYGMTKFAYIGSNNYYEGALSVNNPDGGAGNSAVLYYASYAPEIGLRRVNRNLSVQPEYDRPPNPPYGILFGINIGQMHQNTLVAGIPVYSTYQACYDAMNDGIWDDSELPTESAIRYILSPENSGEVNGPDTYDSTSFTFEYRIKTSYEFKRIRVFAIGETTGTPPIPREETISDVTETYDGDTRTYTFTVSNIPDWAIGVRCVIETIYLPDDQDASGTNASDGPIGGDGTFDDTSDDVPLPAIPTGISASDSGFVTLFRPTIQQVKNLGNYLWSNLDEFWENLQKIFTNPMDYIIGLNTFPVNPPVDADRGIYIGNWLTNITMPPVRNQFYEFDCGTVNIREYFGSFLDYASNTRARIMLPFIGDRDLNINEIMNKTLRLWYRINLLSGECLAVLTIDNNVYYQWNGNCAIPIPLTGSDWSRLYGGIGKTAGAAAGFMLGGLAGETTFYVSHLTAAGMMRNAHGLMGMTIPEPVPALPPPNHGALVPYQYGSPSSMGYNPALFDPPMITETFGLSRPAKAALQAGTSAIIGHNIMGASTRVAHSGDMSGGIGLMGNRTPYIFLEYPNVNLPENYKHLYGYPSNQYATLGNLAGYTECKTVMFESTTATDDEVSLIMETLKSGVYL